MDDGLDFSPLADAEREAAAQQAAPNGEPDAAKPTLPPGDAEPPEAAVARLFGRKPDRLWRYVDATGALVSCVCRWNKPDGEKEIRPLSWFDREGWRFAHWPDARPLYNADQIAANRDAPVIVTEGEKAADAAARIFPRSVATTSSSGANAPRKTDWTPLAVRRVTIWPDNDGAGTKYAGEVAVMLAELDCEVSIIDADALARIDPNGGEREPTRKGWDAANAIDEWRDLDALRNAATGLTKPFDSGPAYLSFPPYTMDGAGLTIEKQAGRGDARRMQSLRIAAAFEVLGVCRDPHGAAWGKLLRWRDDDGRLHTRHIADAHLHGEPAELCGSLAREGLFINRARHREFLGYLNLLRPKRRVTVVTRTGWHDVGGRSVFVLPRETIGPRGGERVVLDAAAHGFYEARGSLEDWRDGAAKLASGHVVLMLAVSAALAGPLLGLAGYEGGGIHFRGPSSTGKTTALRLAASVWGRGDTPGSMRTWRATANGLEGAAAGASDTALILDELGQMEAREFAAAAYMLANGAGKARAHRDGELRDPRTWRLMFLSSGEVSLEAKLIEERGRRPRAGQLVRMLDIPADRVFGVFDNAGPTGDAASLAQACGLAAATAYGTAGPEFVRRLLADDVGGDDVRAMVNDFIATEVPAGADGQVDRAAQRLWIIAVAGELATEFGLTGWREGEARNAARWALRRWIEARGGTEPDEARQAIEAVRHFIEAHGEARFDVDDPDARPVPNRAGWRKGAGEERRWLILPEVWKQDVCAGLDPKFVARVLADRGALAKSSDGNMRVERIAGTPKRVYVVTPRIFDGGEA